MDLSEAKEKEKYKVVSVTSKRNIRAKLTSIGVLEGKIIDVIKNDSCGPIIIGIKNSRISIGRGLSCKIKILKI